MKIKTFLRHEAVDRVVLKPQVSPAFISVFSVFSILLTSSNCDPKVKLLTTYII